ncbi:MAG TPA: FAD-dependent oxidoreductase [Pyrinomonadaceae bacterium]|nr:FAD-dependent oxidoreductase [Pyrinomonadaceae bacterium]
MAQNIFVEPNSAAPEDDSPTNAPHDFQLGIEGFAYSDLYDPARLGELAEVFYAEVESVDPALHALLSEYIETRGERSAGTKAESELLIAAAPHLSRFVARLFGIELEHDTLAAELRAQDPVFQFKQFVQRRATKSFPAERAAAVDVEAADAALEALRRAAFDETLEDDRESGVARMTVQLLEWEKNYPKKGARTEEAWSEERAREIEAARVKIAGTDVERALASWREEENESDAVVNRTPDADDGRAFVLSALRLVEGWAAAHALRADARERVKGWVSFRFPHALNFENLVQIERPEADLPELVRGLDKNLRRRDGFKLTDARYSPREVLDEVNYCIYCHERDKDSCSKGLKERDGSFKKNPLGIKLEGCPLDEKISEMHLLHKGGDAIAALAVVVIDNPMCPGTGHRICNDCMKSCIFQKQEPVNIPQAETGVLTHVLDLPFGFEIYGLLTRWNPLNAKRPYALPYNGKNVLVVGLGPAGYTLAQFLLNEGFGVVGIDGLKIEPLDEDLTGRGGRRVPRAVRDVREIETDLDERVMAGFGGVSEYGITVRWDKNFLTLMHTALARRDHFRFYGGVRFGGTLSIEDAWALGFDHIAVATGAGKPTLVSMKNNLIRGIRKASDFLMALQLTGAAKRDSFANLQVRLPAVVIGGGLTAIDTATELFAYYPVQVEKVLERVEKLTAEFGEEEVWKRFDAEERGVLEEYLEHGLAVRAERERARGAGEAPDFVPLVRGWGGVTICYRKRLLDAPAYRLNHEEVAKSLEEGISFIENMSPVEAVADEQGAVAALLFERQERDVATGKWRATGETVRVPARTVCVAAGTSPNTIYEREKPGTFALDEWQDFFAPHKVERDASGNQRLVAASKGERAFFTSYEEGGRFISYYGDNHPVYAGNVVKAMASAKDGYPHVVALFAEELAALRAEDQPAREERFARLVETLDDELVARVVRVERLTDTIVDVIVRAPAQAREFHPGQFYRLQNYEADAPTIEGTKLTMEGLALTGAWVDKERGLLSLIVLEMGASSRQCALLKPGQQVVVMGPTGTPTEIPSGETVLLAGGGLGNAVLFSIAKALKESGNRVVYFAGYKDGKDLFKREEIEEATDQVIWSTDTGREIEPRRAQDAHFRGNIVEAMKSYAEGAFGTPLFDLREVGRIIAIGSDRMMAAVKAARHAVLAPHLSPAHIGVGSINSPIQCMMKEVCAQCLQRHVNPQTGEESFVFSCFNQDQLLDEVDFQNLSARLRANTVQEKLANLWLDRLLRESSGTAQ